MELSLHSSALRMHYICMCSGRHYRVFTNPRPYPFSAPPRGPWFRRSYSVTEMKTNNMAAGRAAKDFAMWSWYRTERLLLCDVLGFIGNATAKYECLMVCMRPLRSGKRRVLKTTRVRTERGSTLLMLFKSLSIDTTTRGDRQNILR